MSGLKKVAVSRSAAARSLARSSSARQNRHSRRLLKNIAGVWEVSDIVAAQTGNPLTVTL